MRIKSTPMEYAYYKKGIVPLKDATLTVAANSLQYGTTCFAGLRGYIRDGVIRILRLQDHYNRFANGIKILGIKYPLSWEEFSKSIHDVVIANKPKNDFYIRPFVYSDTQMLGPHFDHLQFDMAIYLMEYHKLYDPTKGLKLMISTWRKFQDDMFPTKAKAGGCYLNSALAQTEATADGFDDALMLDTHGCLAEATGANVFIVKNGESIFPDTGFAILEGITRQTAMTLLKDAGYPLRYGRIDRSMAYSSDELILTGTAAQILYAESVEGRTIGRGVAPGPVAQFLMEQYDMLISGKHSRSKEWITEIRL